MIKRKIALVLIAVMLVSQLGMGFSFADSELGKDSVENQNVVISDNLETEQSNAGNIEKEDTKDIGENKDSDNEKNGQTEDEQENKNSGETDIEKTGETDNSDITENENLDNKGATEADKEKLQTQEPTEQMKLLSEEQTGNKSSLESQLEKVTEYYKELGQDAEISAPMEGVARFAVGERASLNALKTAAQMEAQYHLEYREISDLNFGEVNSSDTLSETTNGVNAQTWLAQIVLDILAADGDPADFQGHNYIHELLSSQSATTGFFTGEQNSSAADGLALLALNAYWGNEWPKYNSKGNCINQTAINVNLIKSQNTPMIGQQNFGKGAQWGITRMGTPYTFYNNFWLTQGLSLDDSQKNSIEILTTELFKLKDRNKAVYSAQCETMAAYIIAKLSAGQTVSDVEWKKLAAFQMENGQYKRTASASSANGEATAMAAIALDYGNRLESDANAKSAFLRLVEANSADRTDGKEAEEAVFKAVAGLKTSVDSATTVGDIVALIKEKGDTVSFVSSNEKVVSSVDKEVHPLEAGEPDITVQLKIIIKSGNCATVIRTKVFSIEPENKTFPFEKNMELLKEYYENYPKDEEPKGVNESNQAFSLVSLMNDSQLGGIPYNTQFYGTGGYNSYYVTFQNPNASAVLDWIAMNKDPKQYIKLYPSTGLTEQADLINEILSTQYDNGSFSNPSSTLRYETKSSVLNTMALEAYFGGKDWSNEQVETHYGRIGAIEDIFSHMIDAKDDKYAEERQDINVEGGRTLAAIDRNGGLGINEQIDQSLTVILFSRWLNDETEITVKEGEEKLLKEIAQKEIDGILKTLKYVYDNEGKLSNSDKYKTVGYAYYISALVASGHKDKVDEYGLWDKLRNRRAENGSYYSTPVHKDYTWDPATMAVAMAMGDYQNGKSILASMTYDVSILTDAEAVQKDIANINIPSTTTEKKINLLLKGYYGSTISWGSSNPDLINPTTGSVVRPGQGQMDAVVSLTATIKRGEASGTVTYLIKVPAAADVNNEKGTADYDILSIPLFVTENIELPATGKNGSSIVWESSNIAAITNEGKVTLGDTDTKVIVKATVTNGAFIKVKEFQVTVSKELTGDVVDEAVAQLRAYYNDNRDLTSSYWDIFAAKSALGEDFNNYNFKVYDVKSHRASSSWQGTDYGAVVLQILAQGDNPYNYQGENYVEKLQKFVDEKGWGAWGSPIWAAMALDAAGADPQGHKYNRNNIEGSFKSQLGDLQYGPDLAGWALIPMATTMMRSGNSESTEELNAFVETLKEKQEKTGINKGLFNTGGVDGGSIALSNGCVVSGFMAMQKAGISGFDLTQEEWKKDSTGVLDTLYDQEISGKTDVNTQIAIEFGDVYYGDSVWRRVGVNPEQLDEMIKTAEPLVTGGDGKYTVKSFNNLKAAYETALKVENDADKMKNYYFGQSYFNLRDAVEGLKEKGTAEITIYGKTGSSKILDSASVHKSGTLLNVLQEVAFENGISITNKDNKIAELGGIKADSKGQWYVYKQTSYGDGVRITEPLDQYNVEEGTSLVLKYCEDTSKLAETSTLNQHLVYDAAQSLKIGGAIDSNNEVTSDIVLTNEGLFGTTVTWFPNKLFAINENGKVTRDAKEDISVVLTAKIYLKGTSTEKQFIVKVKSLNGDSSVTPTVKKASISIAGPVGQKWSGKYAKAAIEIEAGETAFSLLEKTGASLDVDKNTQYGVYIRGINGLSEFDKGSQSGWMYRVNGKFPGHSAALERIYENDYVEWLYTTNLGRDVGGYVSGVEESSATVIGKKNANRVSATTSVTASTNNDTKEAKVVLKAVDITKALKELQDKVKDAQQDGKSDVVSELRIDVSTDSQATSIETTVPKLLVPSFSSGVDQISIITAIGDVTFDKDTIKTLTKDITGDLKITIAKTDAGKAIAKISGVTNEVKAKMEGRPVYEFTVQKGEHTVSELGGTAVSVVPYTLGSGEQPEAVVAYWMKPDGSLEIVKNGYLRDDNKYFVMENNHWSTYVIGYNEAKFADTASHWAKKNILYLAARDIIKGKSTDSFLPDSQITRAEFAQILANMSGDDLSKYTGSKFSDVSEKAWYAKAVAWAVENGIAGGTGNDMFSPNANITRQDMSVMISKYAANVSKETLADANKAVQFADDYEIARYAKAAVTSMQKAGIINGVKNNLGSYRFNPKANATRAEATTMIANYIKQ